MTPRAGPDRFGLTGQELMARDPVRALTAGLEIPEHPPTVSRDRVRGAGQAIRKRGRGRSLMGRCTRAAASPSMIPAYQMPS